jgi:hypothetical protein
MKAEAQAAVEARLAEREAARIEWEKNQQRLAAEREAAVEQARLE